ncbi:extracellular solute-binding protein [Haloarchaeobius sp. HRN-SO-5]|uniref:extracellular solute-binding protein n=1 Tax=Haloarchaeobius sp. HRN-SO-5 TaxID=3446118 RepID=UPI003EBECDA4
MKPSASSVGRRAFLAGATAAFGGLAGCTGVLSSAGGEERVSILAAGSLTHALENGLRPLVERPLAIEAHGSAQVARLVASGQKDPDVVSLADVALFDDPLRPDWYAEFATNSVVVAYNPDTGGGQRVADAGTAGWYRPLLDDDVSLGRTDPDLDPLGYRTLFVLDLATGYYDTDVDLRATIPSRDQLYPETQLVSQFETGAIDAAVTYRNMATERDYDFVELPPEVDLSDPAFADRYARTSYELPGGKVVTGGPISYGSTVRNRSPAVVDVFDEHVTGQYLDEFGFVVPDEYPRYTGDVPETIPN